MAFNLKNLNRRSLMLWALLVGSTLYTGSTLLSRRAAATPARGARPAGAQTPGAAAQPAPAAAAAPAAAVPAPGATSQTAPPLPDAELVAWRGTLGRGERDPFFTLAEIDAMNRPAAAPRPVDAPPPPPPPTYVVKLIMMQGGSGRALIDGRVVREGDMLGDERVVEIVPDAVVLERGRERRSLPLAKATSGRTIQLERTR
jgi:hypothetical protein